MRLVDFLRKAIYSGIQPHPRDKKIFSPQLQETEDYRALRPFENNHLNSNVAGQVVIQPLGTNHFVKKMSRNETFEIIECAGIRKISYYN